MSIHKPVLLEEVISYLKLKQGDVVVDATLGGGGYAIEIIKKILPGGRLIAIDWDKKALKRLEFSADKIDLVCDNFANLADILEALKIKKVDKIVADLGLSSDQLEDPERGFSFLKSGPLKMSYDEANEKDAYRVVNFYPYSELKKIIREYGEERYADRIAKAIVRRRKTDKINSTLELAEVIKSAVPARYRYLKIHPATKTFQAIRIEVNNELENLENFLDQSMERLASQGTLAVVAFHSLEDRIVKRKFAQWARNCVCPPDFPVCRCGGARAVLLTRKAIKPTDEEIKNNPRSRSARLRAISKI